MAKKNNEGSDDVPYTSVMRALVYTATGKVRMEQRPRPEPQGGEQEIAIEVAGICGSDSSGFLGHSALRRPPLVLGHELVGRRPDGKRVVANPLTSCGKCQASASPRSADVEGCVSGVGLGVGRFFQDVKQGTHTSHCLDVANCRIERR